MKRLITSLFILAACIMSSAQDKIVKNILETGLNDNRTMQHADYLTNRIGGRIIGSSELEEAEKWAAEKFKEWGMEVMVQEVGEIKVGFERGPFSGRLLAENGMQLHFGTPSYTAGTKGPQKGIALLEPKTKAQFDRIKGQLKGAWVLIDGDSKGWPIDTWETNDTSVFHKEMVEAGVLGFIQRAKVPITLLYDRKHCYDITPETLPTACDIKLDSSQFDIIKQMVIEKRDFLLEFDIRNHFRAGPIKYHNVIGILKGSKYPDEYVMLGGHLDSYDCATGAVDDGNGSSITMEAARLLATSGAKPKRTMMFCLWAGEEFGLLGSKYFVENNTVEIGKIANYLNRDGGPLMSTGITVTDAMYDDIVKICKPLENYCPDIPFTVSKREAPAGPRPTREGGSDHAYFAKNGVPTIHLNESDPRGYNFDYMEIWHTERDLYNKLIPEYMEYSAVAEAVISYGIANLDHLLSREGLYTD